MNQQRRIRMSKQLLNVRRPIHRPPTAAELETAARRRNLEMERALQADELDELNAHDAGRLRLRR